MGDVGSVRVLLTDAGDRATLAAARSLVRAGYGVHVASRTRLSVAGASRGVHAHRVRADALEDPPRYANAIGELARAIGAAVLLPMTDQSVEAVLAHRSSFPRELRIPVPELATFRAASDKITLLDRAGAAGFAVPLSITITSAGDAPASIPASWFPAVLKPHSSVVAESDGRGRKVGVTFVDRANHLPGALAALPAAAFPVLLQQRVEGPGEGFFALRWRGRHVAAFAHRRVREIPPAGGVSVCRESIPLEPQLAEAGWRLLDALDWNGVAMVECKRDVRTGRHVVMEINGRFWGSLQLAIDAGVDFPRLLVQGALGEEVPEQAPYRVGIRSRWFWGEVDHLYMRLRYDAASLHLGGDAPSRLRVLGEFLRLRSGRDRFEWRLRDPAPFLVETLSRFGIGG